MAEEFHSHSVAETVKHASNFAAHVKKYPVLILLDGPLGAGKTEWARAFIQKYLRQKCVITSPTYSVVNAYKKGAKSVYHFDLYRLQGADDLESVGFWDFLEGRNVLVVEWGGLLPPQWPKHVKVYHIKIDLLSEGERKIRVNSLFARGS